MSGLFGNNNSMIWIILLLCMCGGFGGGCDNSCGNDVGGILPILLLCMCGGFGSGCDQKCC